MKTKLTLLLAAGAASAPYAAAQRVLVCESTNDAVMEFDFNTGALVNATFMDLATSTGGTAVTPIEIIAGPNGELWVSDQTADTVFRFSGDGQTLLGQTATGMDNVRGLAAFGPGALVTNAGTNNGAPDDALIETDAMAMPTANTAFTNPFDAHPANIGGVDGFLCTDITNEDIVFVESANLANQTIFHDSDGITGIDFPEQVTVTAGGRILAAGFSAPSGLYEYDAAGNQIDFIDTVTIGGQGGLRGVAELGNGNLLFTNGAGVHIYDVATMTISTVASGVSARYATVLDGGAIGQNYCTAVPNTTGATGEISAAGSAVATTNNFTLTASGLPNNQFGIFITSSTQAFVPGANGSSNGNLCLGGMIGRFVAPGQIMSTGSAGEFSLVVDLTMVPQGAGTVSVMAGDTRNFQAWHREGAGLGSNFTNGLEVTFQ